MVKLPAHADTEPTAAILARSTGVTVEPAAEASALATVPLVHRVEDLLRWVGPRRAVTATGALRRGDIAAASAAVGAASTGATSMWGVPALAEPWSAATEAGLLEVNRTAATPSPDAVAWLSGDEEAATRGRRAALVQHLLVLLTQGREERWLPAASELLLPVLAMCAAGQQIPTPMIDLVAVRALGHADDGLVTGFMQPGRDAAHLEHLVLDPVHDLLDAMTTAGLTHVTTGADGGTSLGVRPGLEAVVAQVVVALLAPLVSPAPPLREVPPAQAARLRIDLLGWPGVWRQVDVDPRTTLGDLHEVIMLAFGWDDDHLHVFERTGIGGRRVRFARTDWDLGADADEDDVAVGLALNDVTRRLRYTYDLGTERRHSIRWVHTVPAERALPRCTGGSGARPPEYEDEPAGPAFTMAAVDRRLAVLRPR